MRFFGVGVFSAFPQIADLLFRRYSTFQWNGVLFDQNRNGCAWDRLGK